MYVIELCVFTSLGFVGYVLGRVNKKPLTKTSLSFILLKIGLKSLFLGEII